MAYRLTLRISVLVILACLSSNTAAISIETLVMPGMVIQDHAEFEKNCSECHAAFSKNLQRDLCLNCHDHNQISEDIDARKGFHGLFPQARKAECSSCHTEHEGRDADIVGLDEETFDHKFTDFLLSDSHVTTGCNGCHEADEKYRSAVSACFGCHEDDDNHGGELGKECENCHKETNWQEADFDHDKDSEFALTGAHMENECNLCHVNQKYTDLGKDCYSCHRIDDTHNGDNGTTCETCHKTTAWDESAFNHADESDFTLEGKHDEIPCESCHTGSKLDDPLKMECIACHRSDDEHQGLNGEDCNNCHKPTKWAKSIFNHKQDTEFPLLGQHKEQICQACHKGSMYDVQLEVNCLNCHEDDNIHKEDQSSDCGQCHQESGWNDNVIFDHDFTDFPLIGLHAVAPCEACHIFAGFHDTGNRCVDCHADDDLHKGRLGEECNACHNPNDWQLWVFDHETEAEFMLDGKHTDLTCRSCHRSRSGSRTEIPKQCAGCHRRDDIHSGQFGSDCGRCHTTGSFVNPGRPE